MSVQKKAGAGAPAKFREEPNRACEPGKPGMGVGARHAAFPLGALRRMDLGQAVPVGQLAENQSSARSKLEVVTSPPAARRSNVLPSLKILVDRPDNDAPPSRLRVFVASAYVVARCRSCSRKVIMLGLVNGKLPACQYRAGKMPALDCRTARVKSRND